MLATSEHDETDTETCGELGGEYCRSQNSATAENVKHHLYLKEELRFLFHGLLQQLYRKKKEKKKKKRKFDKNEIDHMCYQFLLISRSRSSPIKLLQYAGLGVAHSVCGKHVMPLYILSV